MAQSDLSDSPLIDYYRYKGAEPVTCNRESLINQGYRVFQRELRGDIPASIVRHDPRRLSIAIMRFFRKYRKEFKA